MAAIVSYVVIQDPFDRSRWLSSQAAVIEGIAREKDLNGEGDVGGCCFSFNFDSGVEEVDGGEGPSAIAGIGEILVGYGKQEGGIVVVIPGEGCGGEEGGGGEGKDGE